MKKLGIGVQSFRYLSENNLIYIDKTKQIYEMMQIHMHNFFVRPRRFGKSLLLDTLALIYSGQKELFKGTWIYDKIDWVARPLIRIDFTLIEYNSTSLEQGLCNYLASYAREWGVNPHQSAGELLRSLIETMGREKSVVILIDEYEMPITDFVGTEDKRLTENAFTLKKFYSVLKGTSSYIHRSYITGVSKIGKIGILSDLNMLNDLTMHEKLSTLLGYTENELRHYFADYIEEGANRYNCTIEEFLAEVKKHYNGYSWDGIEENRVYNPFSVVNFFQSFLFKNYWFATGTPTILVRGAKRDKITLDELEHIEATGELLENASIEAFYSISLLFQAGYLTIKNVDKPILGLGLSYLLGFPNEEVRNSFASHLLSAYMEKEWAYVDTTISHKLRLRLEKEELSKAFEIFQSVIESTGYDITKHTEGYFHTIMHVLMYSTNITTFSELESAQGRLDTVAITQKAVYIFEFKINSSANTALAQIQSLGYDQRFRLEEKNIYLIGVNFDTKNKKIDDIKVLKWGNETYLPIAVSFES